MIVYLVSGDESKHVATQGQAFRVAREMSESDTFPVDVIKLSIMTDKEAIVRLLNGEGGYCAAENTLRSYHRGRNTRAPKA